MVHTEGGALRRRDDRWWWAEALAPDDAPFGWNAAPVEVPAPPGVPRAASTACSTRSIAQ